MLKAPQLRSVFGSWALEKVRAAVARSTCRINNCKDASCSGHCWKGSWDVQKVHAVAAQSTFPSQNVKGTTCSDHFWNLRCWRSARCGAKHVSRSKCAKHTTIGPLLDFRHSSVIFWLHAPNYTERQTDRRTDGQTDRQTDTWIDRQLHR